MALRKILVTILVTIMASPLWGSGQPLGSITASSDTTIQNIEVTPGSTVFVGDVVSVAEHGAARVAFRSGAQAEVFANSSVRLTTADNKVQMIVDRGEASFHTSGGKEISALVGDAVVRPADGSQTSAILQLLSATHAIVAAEKGTLLVTTAHDGKVYTVGEGEAADLSAAADPQQPGPVPAGKSVPTISSPSKKKVVYWTVAIVGAGAIVAGVLLARRETKLLTTTLQNEISPATLN